MKRGGELKRSTPLRAKAPMSRGTAALQAKPRAALKEAKPAKGPKPKKCANRACRAPYLPDPKQPWKNWCSDDCALVIALDKLAKQKATKQRAERVADRKKRREMMTRPELIAEAQQVFNEFIRYRDRDQPCICCGSFDAGGEGKPGGGWDAGHWISRGHAPHLRFDERNVHKQRKGCNKPGGTTRAKYRVGLAARIGEAAVQELEALEYAPVKRDMTKDEIKAITATYRAKLAALKKST